MHKIYKRYFADKFISDLTKAQIYLFLITLLKAMDLENIVLNRDF